MGAFVEKRSALGRDRGHPPQPVRRGILATAPGGSHRLRARRNRHVARMASVITLEFGTLASIFFQGRGGAAAGPKSFLNFCVFLSTAG